MQHRGNGSNQSAKFQKRRIQIQVSEDGIETETNLQDAIKKCVVVFVYNQHASFIKL